MSDLCGKNESNRPLLVSNRQPLEMQRIKGDVDYCAREIQELLRTGVVQNGWPEEMFWPVMTRMAINILYLMWASERFAKRPINFVDDVLIRERVKDVYSLIRYLRDALCHVESSNHLLNKNQQISFNVARGKGTTFYKMPGTEHLTSEYPDDIALLFGKQRVYVKRHLMRAFSEAITNLNSFFKESE